MAGAAETEGRIGPNAVSQMAAALSARGHGDGAASVFHAAGLGALLTEPPKTMVPEGAVARLHSAVPACFPQAQADALAFDAGRRTAAYILANRIPRPAQWLLRALPPRPAARLLLGAIGRNAWTFAGSGRFHAEPGRPARLAIAANPIAVPGCPWHRGVFAGLFAALVAPHASVRETACCARGAPECRFEIDF